MNLDSHPISHASNPIPATSYGTPSDPESAMHTNPTLTIHNSTSSLKGAHSLSTVTSGQTQLVVVPLVSPVTMGNSLPSQPVQTTPTYHPSSPLPLAPPNFSPPCPTLWAGGSLSTSMDMPIKLPLYDSCGIEASVPNSFSEEAKLLLNSTVKVNFDQAAAIASSTREQSENIDWFKYRQCRLTASNFGAVLKRRKQDCFKLVERLTNFLGNLNVSSLNYGRDNEEIVANYHSQYQERHGHRGIKVFPCGKIVNQIQLARDFPWQDSLRSFE